MLKNIEIIDEIIVIKLIFAIIILVITYKIVNKVLDKIAINKSIEILSSFNYYGNIKNYMDLIFTGNMGLHSRIQVSSQKVNNFSLEKSI